MPDPNDVEDVKVPEDDDLPPVDPDKLPVVEVEEPVDTVAAPRD